VSDHDRPARRVEHHVRLDARPGDRRASDPLRFRDQHWIVADDRDVRPGRAIPQPATVELPAAHAHDVIGDLFRQEAHVVPHLVDPPAGDLGRIATAAEILETKLSPREVGGVQLLGRSYGGDAAAAHPRCGGRTRLGPSASACDAA
jgi:hypothetical protein